MLIKDIKMQYCRVACCLLDLDSGKKINLFQVSFLWQFDKLYANVKIAKLHPTEILEFIPQKLKKQSSKRYYGKITFYNKIGSRKRTK